MRISQSLSLPIFAFEYRIIALFGYCLITTMQISDFGLAVSLDEHGKNNIKLSGTLGYVAPEYLLDGTYVHS